MASPFSNWNSARPTDTEQVSIFPAFERGILTTLSSQSSTGGVLGTLSALAGTSGSVSTGWRAAQGNNDDAYEMQNAYMSNASGAALAFARDDTTKASLACTKEISGPYFRWLYAAAAAGAITWAEVSRLTSAGILSLPQSGSALSIGASAAGTGLLRLPNNAGGIAWRNAGNTADLALLDLDASNNIRLNNTTTALNAVLAGAQAILATTATAGFPYLPYCQGTPTGIPGAVTGYAPAIWDDTNKQFRVYSPGAAAWQFTSQAPQITVVTATGTYTTPAGTKALWVRMVGGGGGGSSSGGANGPDGGGGGAGGYVEKFVASPASSYSCTIGAGGAAAGAGGATTFGTSFLTANGGSAGSTTAPVPGAGGTASGGDINITGAPGIPGGPYTGNAASHSGGSGGSSFLGGGGLPSTTTGGSAIGNSGSGGAGGTVANAGGSGGSGIIIVVAFF